MISNINLPPCIIKLGKEFFRCEFDHKSIDILEMITQKGFYTIYNEFVYQNNIHDSLIINLFAVSVYKNHGAFAMQKVKNYLVSNPLISLKYLDEFKAYFKCLLLDKKLFQENLNYINPKAESLKNSSEFYDFEDSYAISKHFLGWSDTEFWQASPRKFSFALFSLAKYEKEKEKFIQKQETADCIQFLNGIKRLL